MRACRSALTLGMIVAAGLSVLSAQGADPRVGSWHLNVAKSKYSPGPGAQEPDVEDRSGRQRGESDERDRQRHRRQDNVTEYTADYDGKPHPLKGSATADMVTLTRVDSHTTERVDTKGGKTTMTYHRVVSKDGKTMTVTTKGTNAQGQATSNVVVFEKH